MLYVLYLLKVKEYKTLCYVILHALRRWRDPHLKQTRKNLVTPVTPVSVCRRLGRSNSGRLSGSKAAHAFWRMCQNACAAFTIPHLCDQTGLLNACRWMGACAAVLAAQTRVCPAPIPSKPRCARPGGTAKRAGACTSIAWPRSVIVLLGAPAGAWTAIGEGHTVQGASVSLAPPSMLFMGRP